MGLNVRRGLNMHAFTRAELSERLVFVFRFNALMIPAAGLFLLSSVNTEAPVI